MFTGVVLSEQHNLGSEAGNELITSTTAKKYEIKNSANQALSYQGLPHYERDQITELHDSNTNDHRTNSDMATIQTAQNVQETHGIRHEFSQDQSSAKDESQSFKRKVDSRSAHH